MAHIQVREELPGIIGLLDFDRETARPLSELAELLLRRTDGMTPAEREAIATHVSALNNCTFCATSHRMAAKHLFDRDGAGTDPLNLNARVSTKVKALLPIAEEVQRGGRSVSSAHVTRAREAGATDQDIHDTVLIAAAFCMYNRYVDGLATAVPEAYVFDLIGERLATRGYVTAADELQVLAEA
jgi:uncharacterized peroxidase-related enzyme